MPIPAPPPVPAALGGYFIMSYSNGTRTHRMRVHIPPFTAGTGVYLAAVGTETSILSTYNNFTAKLAGFMQNTWNFNMAAIYQYVAGVPTQIGLPQTYPQVAGTVAGGTPADVAVFIAVNMRTAGGRRFRIFIFEPDNTVVGPAVSYVSSGANISTLLVQYLSGGAASNTAILGRDGTIATPPGRFTTGQNKKIRRKQGEA